MPKRATKYDRAKPAIGRPKVEVDEGALTAAKERASKIMSRATARDRLVLTFQLAQHFAKALDALKRNPIVVDAIKEMGKRDPVYAGGGIDPDNMHFHAQDISECLLRLLGLVHATDDGLPFPDEDEHHVVARLLAENVDVSEHAVARAVAAVSQLDRASLHDQIKRRRRARKEQARSLDSKTPERFDKTQRQTVASGAADLLRLLGRGRLGKATRT